MSITFDFLLNLKLMLASVDEQPSHSLAHVDYTLHLQLHFFVAVDHFAILLSSSSSSFDLSLTLASLGLSSSSLLLLQFEFLNSIDDKNVVLC